MPLNSQPRHCQRSSGKGQQFGRTRTLTSVWYFEDSGVFIQYVSPKATVCMCTHMKGVHLHDHRRQRKEATFAEVTDPLGPFWAPSHQGFHLYYALYTPPLSFSARLVTRSPKKNLMFGGPPPCGCNPGTLRSRAGFFSSTGAASAAGASTAGTEC